MDQFGGNGTMPANKEPIPASAIEVISTTDQILPVKAKLKPKIQHDISVVWLIYPETKLTT
jgi:hypothetical protein